MMAPWMKLRELPEFALVREDKKPPRWLEVRQGVHKTSYRVRHRRDGINLQEVLEGEFSSWKEAAKVGDLVNSKAKVGEKPKDKNLIRCEELCQLIVRLRESKADKTYEQTEIFYRLHLVPYLNRKCPYAVNLDATVWLDYKHEKRLLNPTVALFNHYKFFVMLYKYAWQKGILKQRIELDFDEGAEDFREEGLVIPYAEYLKMVDAATGDWRDRIVFGRKTGTRPSEGRCLEKDRFNPATGILSLRKEDTKNRKARAFAIEDPEVLSLLKRRILSSNSKYFFPNEVDSKKPVTPNMKGWHRMLKRAGVNPKYTPHDLRHTYLTEIFKTSINPALICYQAGLSIEEAMKTYLHFKAEDTRMIAKMVSEQT